MSNYTLETIDLVSEIYVINKDGEELIRVYTARVADQILKILREMDTELETYKGLFTEMSYYFDDDVKTLHDLDHKDFQSLKRLSKGLID